MLHYLTVQDVLWINLQATKKVNKFNYLQLEEAVFYQYSYGSVEGLAPQASRFLQGFNRLKPFSQGNAATGFVACLSFLKLNGARLLLQDREAQAWLESALSDESAIASAFEAQTHLHAHVTPDVPGAVEEVLERFPETIAALAAQD